MLLVDFNCYGFPWLQQRFIISFGSVHVCCEAFIMSLVHTSLRRSCISLIKCQLQREAFFSHQKCTKSGFYSCCWPVTKFNWSTTGRDASLATHPWSFKAHVQALQLCKYSNTAEADAPLMDNLCLDYEEAKQLLKSGTAYFVDVREPKELVNDGRIPGTINIPLNDVGPALELPPAAFEKKYGRAKPSEDDPNLFFSCRKGVRATSAMQTAHSKGYTKARFYRGSFCDWVEKGGEVVKG